MLDWTWEDPPPMDIIERIFEEDSASLWPVIIIVEKVGFLCDVSNN